MTAGRVAAGRFLFVLWDGGGNVAPQLGLAARLRARGHTVRLPGGEALSGPSRQARGARRTPWHPRGRPLKS
jgi:hypothetical protein